MDPPSSPIALAERRIAWLGARQQVLATNIAHADTPRYQPRDLRPFAEVVAGTGAIAMARTDARHLAPTGGGAARGRPDRGVAERAPNGNAVTLDEQALKVADTDQAHALALALHRRYLGLFRAALGRQG